MADDALVSHADHLGDLDVRQRAERLDEGMWPVEVAVLVAPGPADDPGGIESRHELRRLERSNDPRGDSELVLE